MSSSLNSVGMMQSIIQRMNDDTQPQGTLDNLPSASQITPFLDRLARCPTLTSWEEQIFLVGVIALASIYARRGVILNDMGRTQEASQNFAQAREYYEAIIHGQRGNRYANIIAGDPAGFRTALAHSGLESRIQEWYQKIPTP